MAISHVSKVFSVIDAKIAKLTADPAGGSPTYATSIDVPGIQEVTLAGDVNTVELRGDNSLLDQNSTLGNITATVTHAKLSLDVLPVLLGGTTADAGTTPNQTATFSLAASPQLNYFKLEAKTPTGGADTPTGDIHFVLHKCIITSFPDMGHANEDYRIVSFECRAVPLVSNSAWLTTVFNETQAAIS